jgi:hydroxyacylglutathione hydrolase
MFRSIDFGKHALGVFAVFCLLLWFWNVGDSSGPAYVERHYDVKEVSATDAKILIDGGALVVDVRGKEAFQSGHIPGAISAPLHDLKAHIPAALEGARTMSMVIYCGDGVTTGPEGTEVLNQAGYPNAVNLKPGLDGWEKAGYPVAKGS